MRPAITLRLDRFAFRQWNSDYNGTKMTGISRDDFERAIQQLPAVTLVDGYAPFCKHVFVRNWIAGLKAPTVALTEARRPLVVSDYQARTEKVSNSRGVCSV